MKGYKQKDFLQKPDDDGDASIRKETIQHMCGMGVLMPILTAACSVFVIYEKHAVLSRRWFQQDRFVDGEAAVWYGISWLFVALFLHFANFWGCFPRFLRLARIGMWVSGVGFFASYVWLIVKKLLGNT